MKHYLRVILLFAFALLHGNRCFSQNLISKALTPIALEQQLTRVIGNEIEASLAAIKVPGARPDSLFGEAIGGEYNWPSFILTLAKYGQLSKNRNLGNYSLHDWIASYIQRQDLRDANTFSQLYYMNTFWLLNRGVATRQSQFFSRFDVKIQEEIINAADYRRSFDMSNKRPINGRPRNYVAVAALTEAYALKNNFVQDKTIIVAMLQDILAHLRSNEGFLDDDYGGNGRFDRYNFEYLRFAYMAADLSGEQSLKKELLPFVKNSAAIWWQMFNPETGHSSPYGRSLQNAWDDTFEQTAFYAQYPETAPTTLPQLAAAFVNGVNAWFSSEYNFQTHLNRMLDPGRATWSYAGRNRIWSYTFHSLGKMAYSAHLICEALKKAKVPLIEITPVLGEVNCFFPFDLREKTQGIWVYRKANKYFVVPIVNGKQALQSADYYPIPYGLPGMGFLVNTRQNSSIPWFKTQNGNYFSLSGAATGVYFDDLRQVLKVQYQQLYPVGKTGNPIPVQLQIEYSVSQLPFLSLTAEYTLKSPLPDSVSSVELVVHIAMPDYNQANDEFNNGKSSLQVSLSSNLPNAAFQEQIAPIAPEFASAFSPNYFKKKIVVEDLKGYTSNAAFLSVHWVVKPF